MIYEVLNKDELMPYRFPPARLEATLLVATNLKKSSFESPGHYSLKKSGNNL